MAKHLAHDLAQMQSLPLEAKIIMTKQRIRQWYEYWEGNVYVSFSGGKDSTVLKHIVDSMYDDVPAVFVNTGLEYPEIQSFVREVKAGKYDCFNSDVEMVRPEMRFDEVLKKYGFPVLSKELALYIRQCQNPTEKNETTRRLLLEGIRSDGTKVTKGEISEKWKYLVDAPFKISEKCCDVMKKKPAKVYGKKTDRKPLIGTLASESRLRYTKWLQNGCNSFELKNPSSQPLSFWTEQDILCYIKKYDVPYCSVYGDIVGGVDTLVTTGCDRTGCIFCMFGCHLEKEPNRFQRLKETHPRQYDYCINGGEMVDGKWQPNKEGPGLGKVLDYIGVDYE
jgi:3'-phosphoadenosine 5'-phosphosulfate sulfotransferase (PAPS reductase)/FAD synthetase